MKSFSVLFARRNVNDRVLCEINSWLSLRSQKSGYSHLSPRNPIHWEKFLPIPFKLHTKPPLFILPQQRHTRPYPLFLASRAKKPRMILSIVIVSALRWRSVYCRRHCWPLGVDDDDAGLGRGYKVIGLVSVARVEAAAALRRHFGGGDHGHVESCARADAFWYYQGRCQDFLQRFSLEQCFSKVFMAQTPLYGKIPATVSNLYFLCYKYLCILFIYFHDYVSTKYVIM